LKELIILGREDVSLVHPENGFNGLILNWCIGGFGSLPPHGDYSKVRNILSNVCVI
jgi:hypothetical protein